MPFLLALPVAFVGAAAVGWVLERTLYRRLYQASHLDQVLFSIGLTFMAMAGANYLFGPGQQPVELPDALRGQVRVGGLELGVYRLFLIGVVVPSPRRSAGWWHARALARRYGPPWTTSRPRAGSASMWGACSA